MNHPSLEIALAEAAKKHPSRVLERVYGVFIAGWRWGWFVTLTFVTDIHPERALKLYWKWCSMINRKLYGRRWNKKEPRGLMCVVAVERQKSGRVHLHALIAGVGNERRLTWMDVWERLDEATGFARVEEVQDQDRAARYVAKYVAKEGELDFSRNLKIESRELFGDPSQPEFGT